VANSHAPGPGEPAPITFTSRSTVDARLRGRTLLERSAPTVHAPLPTGSEDVVAQADGVPMWVVGGAPDAPDMRVARLPDELAPTETLRDRLTAGTFIDLLPLVAFLRNITAGRLPTGPPTMATLLIDDPNLHARQYGFIDLPQLARNAETRGYHVTLATIPIDGWFVSPKAADVFRNSRSMSLVMHGNAHIRHELGREGSQESRFAQMAQALRRARRVEQKTGLSIGRVMTAPHGRCSQEMTEVLSRLGFESLCISRPYPWLSHPPSDAPLAGWRPTDASTRLPIVPRMPFTVSDDELVLRSYLGHPIVLYGHHGDFSADAGSPDGLAERVDSIPGVRWASLSEISRSLVSTRLVDGTLQIVPHTRKVSLTIPDGAERLTVTPPPLGGEQPSIRVVRGDGDSFQADDEDLSANPGDRITVTMEAQDAVDPLEVHRPVPSPWPWVRRALTETRDRLAPYALGRTR
jgi:hypothetical protein